MSHPPQLSSGDGLKALYSVTIEHHRVARTHSGADGLREIRFTGGGVIFDFQGIEDCLSVKEGVERSEAHDIR